VCELRKHEWLCVVSDTRSSVSQRRDGETQGRSGCNEVGKTKNEYSTTGAGAQSVGLFFITRVPIPLGSQSSRFEERELVTAIQRYPDSSVPVSFLVLARIQSRQVKTAVERKIAARRLLFGAP